MEIRCPWPAGRSVDRPVRRSVVMRKGRRFSAWASQSVGSLVGWPNGGAGCGEVGRTRIGCGMGWCGIGCCEAQMARGGVGMSETRLDEVQEGGRGGASCRGGDNIPPRIPKNDLFQQLSATAYTLACWIVLFSLQAAAVCSQLLRRRKPQPTPQPGRAACAGAFQASSSRVFIEVGRNGARGLSGRHPERNYGSVFTIPWFCSFTFWGWGYVLVG